MTALESLKSKQARIESLRIDAAKAEAEAEALENEIKLAIEVSKDYEEKAEEKKMYDSEALATLLVKITSIAGDALDDAVREFAEAASLDIPKQIQPADEETTEEAATGTT